MLKWAHENGCPWDEGTCMYAAEDDAGEYYNLYSDEDSDEDDDDVLFVDADEDAA